MTLKIKGVIEVMNKLYATLVAFVFSLVLVSPSFVYAQTGTVEQDVSEEVTTQNEDVEDAEVEAEQETPNQSQRPSTRQERIDQYKDRVSERLTAARERRIANGCKAAQGKVTSLQNNLARAVENRKGVYAKINERLSSLVLSLQAASVDVTELEEAIASIEMQSNEIVEKIALYRATLEDLAAMDCAADPEGFAAALSVAREQREDVLFAIDGLKSYITVDVKIILDIVRELLDETTTDPAVE